MSGIRGTIVPNFSIIGFVADAIARLLPTKSVDAAVAALGKAAGALAAAEAGQNAKARALQDQANKLLSQAASASAEGERAGRVRENLEALIA